MYLPIYNVKQIDFVSKISSNLPTQNFNPSRPHISPNFFL